MRRAVGIVRVSVVGDRSGESFVSPGEQRERIVAACDRDGLDLAETIEEMDISGPTKVEKRAGLRRAIELVEAGTVQVIVVAYFDRLVRSLVVQAEILERVEKAGGRVLAVDFGEVSHDTAAKWLSATMIGMVSEYQSRQARERSVNAVTSSIARGVIPFGQVPPGLLLDTTNRLVHDPVLAPVVRDAFRLRADEGWTIKEVREFLRGHGVERSYHGVQSLLGSSLLVGEMKFGTRGNESVCEPIVDRDVWERVQGARVPRGRRGSSDRLLARLGVLRCGSCGARMTVGTQTQNGRRYAFYRCPPVGDCIQRVTIGAGIAETVVADAVRAHLVGLEGRASAEGAAITADTALAESQRTLDAAIVAFDGLEGEAAAVRRLRELRDIRDEARDRAEHLRRQATARTVTVADWDLLTGGERRGIIAAVVDRATVSKAGRRGDRVTVHFVGE